MPKSISTSFTGDIFKNFLSNTEYKFRVEKDGVCFKKSVSDVVNDLLFKLRTEETSYIYEGKVRITVERFIEEDE